MSRRAGQDGRQGPGRVQSTNRAIGYTGPGGLVLYSRNDRDISRSYPEVAALELEAGLVVDGELVALDGRGRPDFGLLQQRMHVARPAADLIARVAVQYVVFDVLRRDDRSLLALPYQERRGVLGGLGLAERGLVVPGNFTDTPGEVVLAAVAQQGLEGVVAKRLTSPVSAGRAVAGVDQDTDPAHRGGHHRGLGTQHRQRGRAGCAAAGRPRPGRSAGVRRGCRDRVHRRRPPPSIGSVAAVAARGSTVRGEFVRARGWPGRPPGRSVVHWVQPRLVGEVEYRAFTLNRTTAGGTFRHPSWRGLRPDREPDEVRLPTSS